LFVGLKLISIYQGNIIINNTAKYYYTTQINMNTQLPEHLDAQYIYRDYGGYVFKLPRNKDLGYQSVELQEYYYWTLAEQTYKQLIVDKYRTTSTPSAATQVAGWEIPTGVATIKQQATTQGQITSRYVELNEIKKPLRDKLIATALAQVFTTTSTPNANNSFQYIEQMT
jgi:hypothetical protein